MLTRRTLRKSIRFFASMMGKRLFLTNYSNTKNYEQLGEC